MTLRGEHGNSGGSVIVMKMEGLFRLLEKGETLQEMLIEKLLDRIEQIPRLRVRLATRVEEIAAREVLARQEAMAQDLLDVRTRLDRLELATQYGRSVRSAATAEGVR